MMFRKDIKKTSRKYQIFGPGCPECLLKAWRGLCVGLLIGIRHLSFVFLKVKNLEQSGIESQVNPFSTYRAFRLPP
jgi:hypothetical protein